MLRDGRPITNDAILRIDYLQGKDPNSGAPVHVLHFPELGSGPVAQCALPSSKAAELVGHVGALAAAAGAEHSIPQYELDGYAKRSLGTRWCPDGSRVPATVAWAAATAKGGPERLPVVGDKLLRCCVEQGQGVRAELRKGRTAYRGVRGLPPSAVDAVRAYQPGDRMTWVAPAGAALGVAAVEEFLGTVARAGESDARGAVLYTLRGVTDIIERPAAHADADDEVILPPLVDVIVDAVTERAGVLRCGLFVDSSPTQDRSLNAFLSDVRADEGEADSQIEAMLPRRKTKAALACPSPRAQPKPEQGKEGREAKARRIREEFLAQQADEKKRMQKAKEEGDAVFAAAGTQQPKPEAQIVSD